MRVNPEKKEEKERVTHALIRATLSLAASHGFVSLGLREVARAADIAPTSFYRHFPDMEQLGLTLIDELAGNLVASWVAVDPPAGIKPQEAIEMLVTRALASVADDPELMRFVLSERVGAIASFRVALDAKLGAVRATLQTFLAPETAGKNAVIPPSLPDAADAAATLLFEACGKVLDQGNDKVPAVRAQLLRQLRVLVAGASTIGSQS